MQDLIPTDPLRNKNFLASDMSVSTEPFQRTDISTQPLGPIPHVSTDKDVFVHIAFIPIIIKSNSLIGEGYIESPSSMKTSFIACDWY
jgi:hypothetical protein